MWNHGKKIQNITQAFKVKVKVNTFSIYVHLSGV